MRRQRSNDQNKSASRKTLERRIRKAHQNAAVRAPASVGQCANTNNSDGVYRAERRKARHPQYRDIAEAERVVSVLEDTVSIERWLVDILLLE